jgi:hypothetical protein
MTPSQQTARALTDALADRSDAPSRAACPEFWQAVYFALRDAYDAGASA